MLYILLEPYALLEPGALIERIQGVFGRLGQYTDGNKNFVMYDFRAMKIGKI